jgi:hypothetical protein
LRQRGWRAQHSAGRRNLAVLLADSTAAAEEQLLYALAKDVDACWS